MGAATTALSANDESRARDERQQALIERIAAATADVRLDVAIIGADEPKQLEDDENAETRSETAPSPKESSSPASDWLTLTTLLTVFPGDELDGPLIEDSGADDGHSTTGSGSSYFNDEPPASIPAAPTSGTSPSSASGHATGSMGSSLDTSAGADEERDAFMTGFAPGGTGGPGWSDPGASGPVEGADTSGAFLTLFVTGISEDTGDPVDLVTNDTTPAVIGTGTPGMSLALLVDGQAKATGAVSSNGEFSIASPEPLSDGEHELTVVGTEGASEIQSSLSVTIDTTGPDVELVAPEFSITTTPTLTVEVELDADPMMGVRFAQIDVDLNNDGVFEGEDEIDYEAVDVFSEETEVKLTTPLEEGTYQLRARVSDSVGNEGVSPTVTMQVDPNAGFIGSMDLIELGLYANSGSGGPSVPGDDGDGGAGADGMEGGAAGGMDDLGGTPGTGGDFTLPSGRTIEEVRGNVQFDKDGRVLISVRATLTKHVEQMRADLESLGMVVVDVTLAQNMVSGYLPIDKLLANDGRWSWDTEILRYVSADWAREQDETWFATMGGAGGEGAFDSLEELPNLSTAVPVGLFIKRPGSANTGGDAPILGPQFRASQGVDGTGVTVGVISDTVNQVDSDGDGTVGIAESQATGDLPAAGVQVLLDGPAAFATDEGRAMLEIIHDVAPGATLAFHTAIPTPQTFATGIGALAAAGARSIVDDIGYFNSPFFNDGVIAQAADDAVAAGALYTTAAGNDADTAWVDAFNGASTTVGGINGTFHDLGGGDFRQDITVPAGLFVLIAFQWDNAYLEGGSPLAPFQVQTDLAVRITDAAGTLVGTVDTNNLNTDEAFEFIALMNTTAADQQAGLSYQLIAGPAPTRLKWISLGFDPQAQGQGAPTMWGQVVAQGATAIAAVPYNDPTNPEPFTSLGGAIDILFARDGTRLGAPDVRIKPEVAAPDGVDTSFFGSFDSDGTGFPNFFGTSAAAPHAAAAAALLLQQEPLVSATQLAQHLERTSIDVGAPGFDDLTGAGLIQLVPLPDLDNLGPDRFEDNDTSDRATGFGVVTIPGRVTDLNINRDSNGTYDFDWYRAVAGASGTFTATVEAFTDNLELHLFKLIDNVPYEVGASSGSGDLTVATGVAAGDVMLIHVKGRNSAPGVMGTGIYGMTFGVT